MSTTGRNENQGAEEGIMCGSDKHMGSRTSDCFLSVPSTSPSIPG